MQLLRILLTLTALIAVEAQFRIPSFIRSLLPFTFNITTDDTGLGEIVVNVKPKGFSFLGREEHGEKIKRDVGELFDESRQALLNTANWELGLPSGASLTLGSIGALAGIIWTVVEETKKFHLLNETASFKHQPHASHGAVPDYYQQPASSYGPVYGAAPDNYQPGKKPKKGFFKGHKGIKDMQGDPIKGLAKLIGLKNLKKLLNPEGKKKLKKRPMPQYYAYEPAYQSYAPPPEYAAAYAPPLPDYASSAYAPPPDYAPPPAPPAYAPPPAPPAYAPPPAPPAYAPPPPPPAYAPPPAPPAYAPPPAPPAYAPPPAPPAPPAYAPPPAPPAPPAYAPPPAPPAYAPPPAPPAPPAYAPPPAPPAYAPPPAGSPTPEEIYVAPEQMSPPENQPSWMPPPPQRDSKEIPAPWNMPLTAQVDSQPTTSMMVGPPSDPARPSLIQASDFLPIIPSQIDPLPFMPSPTFESQKTSNQMENSATFGVPPPRKLRSEETKPLDPTRLQNSQPRSPQSIPPSTPQSIPPSTPPSTDETSPNIAEELFEIENGNENAEESAIPSSVPSDPVQGIASPSAPVASINSAHPSSGPKK